MMQAAQHRVRAAGLLDVVDFQPIGLAEMLVLRMRSGRRLVPAARTPVLVALLGRTPRERPPVVFPKCVAAAIAAPHLAPRWKEVSAPPARAIVVEGERAGSD